MDYSKNTNYKICCKDLTVKDEYVGSTTNMVKRRSQHKSVCGNDKDPSYNLYVYQFIRAHGGFQNWDMIEVEAYPCANSEQARSRERFWYEQLGATLNTNRPIETKEENKTRMIAYADANSEKLSQYAKGYYKANLEKITSRNLDNKKLNYNFLKDQNAERITCECGVEHSRGNTARHKRSSTHIKAMAAL